ncbi:Transcriptional repressor CcpN [bioreactor metagenome]|uniref:Transcriptional repressor CcpN n=1 Tax=bioreactor metagenome TaxID=1076179 RepID=A0A645F423_9ZZZZ
MDHIELTPRQSTILDIVKTHGPITGNQIAEKVNLSRAALRPDLAILTRSGLLGARPRVGYYFTGKDPADLIASVLGQFRVADIHSIPIVVRENCSVYDAIVTMFIEDVGTVFVVSEGSYLEGVISRKDLLKSTMGGKNINDMPVKIVMTRMPNIIVTSPHESVLRAAQKLISHQVDSLPVIEAVQVDGQEKFHVVGRFTKTNITRLFVQLVENKN